MKIGNTIFYVTDTSQEFILQGSWAVQRVMLHIPISGSKVNAFISKSCYSLRTFQDLPILEFLKTVDKLWIARYTA